MQIYLRTRYVLHLRVQLIYLNLLFMVHTLYANVCLFVSVFHLKKLFICLIVFHFIVDIANSFIRVYVYSVRSRYYGVNCSDTCGHCVSGSTTCHIATGQCPGGCSAGWKGETCKTGVFFLNI